MPGPKAAGLGLNLEACILFLHKQDPLKSLQTSCVRQHCRLIKSLFCKIYLLLHFTVKILNPFSKIGIVIKAVWLLWKEHTVFGSKYFPKNLCLLFLFMSMGLIYSSPVWLQIKATEIRSLFDFWPDIFWWVIDLLAPDRKIRRFRLN